MNMAPEWEYEPDSNGMYPASTDTENSDMDKYWIRDNYFIYKAIGDKSIPESFRRIVQEHQEKLREAAFKHHMGEIESPSEHLHPRFDEELEEIDGEWADFQIDSYANLLEVLSEEGYEKEAKEVYRYLRGINPLSTACFDLWEDDYGVHPYTLATVAKAYRSFSENVEKIPEEDIELYEEKVKSMLPERNLSSLLILYIDPEFVDEELEEEVIDEIEPLTGEHGVARWEGDDWSGIDWTAETEPEWNMGHLLRYLSRGDQKFFERQKEIKSKHGEMPESMVRFGDGKFYPNVNSPLLWTEALYAEAERKYMLERSISSERYKNDNGNYSLQVTGNLEGNPVDVTENILPGVEEFSGSLELARASPESQLNIAMDDAREKKLERISIET